MCMALKQRVERGLAGTIEAYAGSFAADHYYTEENAVEDFKQAAEAAQILESIVKEYGASEWVAPSQRLLKEVKP